MLILSFLLGGAWAGEEEVARYKQDTDQMTKLASRNAWKGVEEAWIDARALGQEISPQVLLLAADSARNLGDAWQAYQRLLAVLRASPDDPEALGQMAIYRERYGRLTVRRVEITPIELTRVDPPFDADERHAIEFAQAALLKEGGFDGMVPAGNYLLGDTPFFVTAGMEPVVLQRNMGDGSRGRKH